MKTKKQIVELLKTSNTATIAFKHLASIESVDKARKDIIDGYQQAIDKHNTDHPEELISLTVKTDDNKQSISLSNGQFCFLPTYPRTGDIVVRSKDYIIGGVYCDIKGILADTFADTADNYAFKTTADNTVIIPKN